MYAKPGLDRARGGSLAERWIPALRWARDYGAGTLTADLLAALIVTVMLIPQSLAYAMLAGCRPRPGSTPRSCRWSPMRSSAPAGRCPSGRWR